jgi:single-strand DNA-binding protein
MALPTLTGTGRLTSDPELRFSQNGVGVCTVSLAFNSRRLNQQTQQWEDGDVYYVRGLCFKALAENVVETLQKGMEVNVSGELHVERWEKDGVKHEMPKLMIRSIGPNLAYATARVTKAVREPASGGLGNRNGNGNLPQQNRQPAAQQTRQQPPQDDPWSVPASNEEPPF